MSAYPEHDKLRAIQTQSQAIGEFLAWLEDGGPGEAYGAVELAYRPLYGRKGDKRPSSHLLTFNKPKTGRRYSIHCTIGFCISFSMIARLTRS